jgi:hypothetical protein
LYPIPYQVRDPSTKSTALPSQVKTFEATEAISLSSEKASTAELIQLTSHLASLLSNPIISPLDLFTPRLTPPAKPRFSSDSTKVICFPKPFNFSKELSPDALSTTTISSWPLGLFVY